jgi:hypothetical protein
MAICMEIEREDGIVLPSAYLRVESVRFFDVGTSEHGVEIGMNIYASQETKESGKKPITVTFESCKVNENIMTLSKQSETNYYDQHKKFAYLTLRKTPSSPFYEGIQGIEDII